MEEYIDEECESLSDAIHKDNQEAVKRFDKATKEGKTIRIM